MSILLSEESIEVFVPREWRGIQGFEPVEFEFRVTFRKENVITPWISFLKDPS